MRKYTMLVRKHLAGWVRRTRAIEELTQEKMSEQLRMSTRAYSNLDHEKSSPSARATPHKDNYKTTVESIGKAISNQSWGRFLVKVPPYH